MVGTRSNLRLVHADAQGHNAVLLNAGSGHSSHTRVTIGRYLTYTGSLTTPPCTGGVRWHLVPKVINIDPASVRELHTLIATVPGYDGYPDNNRPVQPLDSRTVQARTR